MGRGGVGFKEYFFLLSACALCSVHCTWTLNVFSISLISRSSINCSFNDRILFVFCVFVLLLCEFGMYCEFGMHCEFGVY